MTRALPPLWQVDGQSSMAWRLVFIVPWIWFSCMGEGQAFSLCFLLDLFVNLDVNDAQLLLLGRNVQTRAWRVCKTVAAYLVHTFD